MVFCRFPTDPDRRTRWCVKIRRQNSNGKLWKPGPGAVICSEHFRDIDFYWQWGRKLIKPDAAPTVFTFAPPPPEKKRKLPCNRLLSPLPNYEAPVDNNNLNIAAEVNVTAYDNVADVSSDDVTNTSSIETVTLDHHYCVKSPRKLAKQVHSLVTRLNARNTSLRNSRRRENRLHGKVGDLLKRIKNMQLITDKANDLLETYKDIPLKLLSGKNGRKFTDEQRQFALTVFYYSPAAYKFIRRRFKLLPSPRTIRKWLASFDGSPGLTLQSFNTIAQKNMCSDQESSAYRLCALHVDEMEIKKQIEFDRTTGKLYGFTDIGNGMYI